MMQATVSVKALRDATTFAAFASQRDSAIPILGMLRLEVADGHLSVGGTDLDIHITASCPLIGGAPGAICVPGRIKDLLRALPNWESIGIREADDRRVVIDMPDGRVSLIGVDASDFPDLTSAGDDEINFDVDCLKFRKALERVSPFISSQETRYYLNGIMMRAKDGFLQLVATNGHMLARLNYIASPFTLGERIVPRMAITRLLRAMPRSGSMVIHFNKAATRVRFVMSDGAVEIHSKLIDGTFPQFERVIPNQSKSVYSLDRASVLGALRRIAALTPRKYPAVHLFEQHDGRVAISRRDKVVGDVTLALSGKRIPEAQSAMSAEPANCSLSYEFLRAAISAHHASEVRLFYDDPGTAIKIETDEFVSVVMPMRSAFDPWPLPDGAVA